MKYNLGDDDDKEDQINDLVKALNTHSKNLQEKSYEEVAYWIGEVSRTILDLIDEIEDDHLGSRLTHLVGAVLGGMGQAVLELREENEMLKHDILYKLQGDVDPELN